MKKQLLALSCLSAIFAYPGISNASDKVIMKMATLAPEGTPWIDTWYNVAKEMESKAPFPIKIVTYAGGVMGDEPDMVKKLKFGQIQMIGTGASGIAKLMPEILVLNQPFLFDSYAEVDYVVKKLKPKFEEIAESRGLYLFGLSDAGMISTWSKEKVKTPTELLSQRVWVWNSDEIGVEMARALDISAVMLGIPEVLTSLQTGLVNTVFGNSTVLAALQWHSHLKYHYPMIIRYDPAVMIASKKLWTKIPEEHHAAFDKLNRELEQKHLRPFIEELRVTETKLEKELIDGGIEQIHFSEADVAELKKKSMEVREKLADKLYPRELMDQVLAAIAEYRAQAK